MYFITILPGPKGYRGKKLRTEINVGGFLDNIKRSLASFMQGRYGIDSLSTLLIIVGFVLTFVAMFTGLDLLSYVSLVFLIFALFRSYSKNFTQRSKELASFQKLVAGPQAWFALSRKKWQNRETTRYFKCKECGSVLSVPVGKGTIRTTCPKCKNQTTRKS